MATSTAAAVGLLLDLPCMLEGRHFQLCCPFWGGRGSCRLSAILSASRDVSYCFRWSYDLVGFGGKFGEYSDF